MYNEHFGLKHAPFKITPDTRLFYPGGKRGEVLDALMYAIGAGEGIVKVVGEVGSGKTMLCRMLEERLPESVEIVYLANPSLSPEDTLHAIALEMNLDVDAGANRLQVMHALHQRLLDKHAEGRQVVVFVEEAQSMPEATLEEIRLLSNLETKRDKLLQIVLFGQPELDEKLAQPHIRQLNERITHSFYLQPFTSDQIREYVNHRLRAAGYRGPDMFRNGAYRRMAQASGGLTRRINILADKALLAAYAENTHDVTSRHVDIAIRDSRFPRKRRRWRFGETTMVAGLLVLVATLGWVLVDDDAPSLSDLASSPADAPDDEAIHSRLLAALERIVGASPQTPAAAPAAGTPGDASPVREGDDERSPEEAPAAGAVAGVAAPEESADGAGVAATERARGERAPAAATTPIALVAPAVGGDGGTGRLLLSDTLTHPPSAAPSGEDAPAEAAAESADVAATAGAPSASPAEAAAERADVVSTATPSASPSASPSATNGPIESPRDAPATVDAPDSSLSAPVAQGPGTGQGGAAVRRDGSVGPLTEARLLATRGWLEEADRTHFSIQLLLTDFSRRDDLEAFLRARREEGRLEDYYVYETRIRNRVWFGVLYREYESFREAKAALEELPAELARHQPFIRNVRDIATLG